MPVCDNDNCGRLFVGASCPRCERVYSAGTHSMNEGEFGSSTQNLFDLSDIKNETTVQIQGDYVQNIDNSTSNETSVGGDFLSGENPIKSVDSAVVSKPSISGVSSDDVDIEDRPQPSNPDSSNTSPLNIMKFCSSCGLDLRTFPNPPAFCPGCGQKLEVGG